MLGTRSHWLFPLRLQLQIDYYVITERHLIQQVPDPHLGHKHLFSALFFKGVEGHRLQILIQTREG